MVICAVHFSAASSLFLLRLFSCLVSGKTGTQFLCPLHGVPQCWRAFTQRCVTRVSSLRNTHMRFLMGTGTGLSA
jgi:hypothetical protein